MFAAAGDRIGLWDPVKPPPPLKASTHTKKHVRTKSSHRRGVAVSRARLVRPRPEAGPPVEAGTAFEFSALLAALAAALGVGRRMAFAEAQTLGQPRRRLPSMDVGAVVSRPVPAGRSLGGDAIRRLRAGWHSLQPLLRFVGKSFRDVGTSAGRVAQASAQSAGEATATWIAQRTDWPRREEVVFGVIAVVAAVVVGCLVVTLVVR
jgi:hypothetical protein